MSTPTRKTIRDLDVPPEQVAAEAKASRRKHNLLLEQRHQYLDLDPDATCCPDGDGFACVTCLPRQEAGS